MNLLEKYQEQNAMIGLIRLSNYCNDITDQIIYRDKLIYKGVNYDKN